MAHAKACASRAPNADLCPPADHFIVALRRRGSSYRQRRDDRAALRDSAQWRPAVDRSNGSCLPQANERHGRQNRDLREEAPAPAVSLTLHKTLRPNVGAAVVAPRDDAAGVPAMSVRAIWIAPPTRLRDAGGPDVPRSWRELPALQLNDWEGEGARAWLSSFAVT